MNPNFQQDSQDAQAPDMAEEQGEGNQLTFSTQEYPELEGVQQGAPVSIKCQGTVTASDNGSVTVNITGQCEIQTEGQADKAMKQMSAQDYTPPSGGSNESDF